MEDYKFQISKSEKWFMINKILNAVRAEKGVKLVNPKTNPYFKRGKRS